MKIVLIAPDLEGRSGWSRYALDLSQALGKRGHTVHAFVAETRGVDWCTEHHILRQPTSYLKNPLLCLLHAWRMRQVLRKLKPDVIHFIAEPYALMLPFLGTSRWNSILTMHGSYAVVPWKMHGSTRFLFTRACEKIGHIISVSAFTKSYVKQEEPALWSSLSLNQKITVIHNAIDTHALLHPPKSEQKDGALRILSVSGVKEKKGYASAIEACALFLKKHPTALQYDIVGSLSLDPTFVSRLRARIDALELTSVIRFHGSVDEATLQKLYHAADLFLLPSLHQGPYFEGFGLVFLEAAAHGVPCIGPTTGGCPEAIEHGVSGYVLDPKDPQGIAEHMADILIHKRIQREDCRAWAQAHDIHIAAEKIEQLYRMDRYRNCEPEQKPLV